MLFDDDHRPESQNPNKNKMNRLGTTFHRTFWLSRSQIRQLLSLAASTEPNPHSSNCLTAELIREQTHLGTVQVEAMPRYARACGLLDDQLCLTLFGKRVQEDDPLLERRDTQWLMHYFISSNHGLGPPFWSRLVSSCLRIGDELEQQEVIDVISQVVNETEGRKLKDRDAHSTSTVFLKSYIETDALGNLGILQELGNVRYLVLEPVPPSVWAFGIALLDYWEAQYGFQRLSIDLDDLSAAGGLGDLFLMGAGRISQYLRQLQEAGYVEVYRLAPPYQVVLRQHDKRPLLEKLYAIDDNEPY